MERRLSLASGVLPEYDALTVARCAGEAGFTDAGLMVRPGEWRIEEEAQLKALQASTGIGFLDVEVLWIPKGAALTDALKSIVDVGVRLGADHVLVVSDEADPAVLAPALERISDWCDGQIKPVLEFLRITAVGSLSQVQELLQAGGAHDFGILIDSLHLARSDEYDRLAELDPAMFPYIQLCDGRNECADDYDSLLADALDGRLAPGEGELPLQRLLEALPADLPLSLEVRSRHYRDAFSDPVARAKAVWHQTTEFLKRDGGLT